MAKVIYSSNDSIPALFDSLMANGLESGQINALTGIDISALNDPHPSLPIEQYVRLWELAIEVSQDPTLPFFLKDKFRKNTLHYVICLGINSANPSEAVYHWKRYSRLIDGDKTVDVRREQDRVIIRTTNTLPEHQNRWTVEYNLAQAIRLMRTCFDNSYKALEIRFKHSAPRNRNVYQEFFKCPVAFEQDENAIVVNGREQFGRFVSSNPHLQAILIQYADENLSKLEKTFVCRNDVQELLIKNLPSGNISIESIAQQLGTNRSTLHRRLKKEGITFSELLEETRKKLAKSYLRQNMSASHTAFQLGFSDHTAFQHAFKRWFNMTPGQYQKTEQET